jgi:hypothetical protein
VKYDQERDGSLEFAGAAVGTSANLLFDEDRERTWLFSSTQSTNDRSGMN